MTPLLLPVFCGPNFSAGLEIHILHSPVVERRPEVEGDKEENENKEKEKGDG